MADSDLIKVGTSVDTSGLKSGMAEASSVTRASLEELKSQYAEAATQVKAISQQMADAQKAGLNPATLQIYKQALDEAKSSMAGFGVQIAEVTSGLQSEAAATQIAAAATERLSVSHGHAVSEIQAASAAIRVFEGALPIRAVERFAVSALGLGPILQAAFPIIGALAFAEAIEKMVTEVKEWIDGTKQIKELNETIGKELIDNNKFLIEHIAHMKELHAEVLAVTDPAAAERYKQGLFGDKLTQDKAELVNLEGQLKIIQERMESLRGTTAPDTSISPFQHMLKAGNDAKELKTLQDTTLPEITGQLARLRATIEEESTKIVVAKEKSNKDQEREDREAVSRAKASFRELESNQRNADIEALADLKADHQVTVAEEIAFWQQRLETERVYGDNVRVIKREIGTLSQEADRQAVTAEKESLRERVEAERAGQESVRRIAEAQKTSVNEEVETWEAGGKRTLQATIDRWNGIKATYQENSALVKEAILKVTDAERQLREEQAKAAEQQTRGQGEAAVGALQGRRQQVERAGVTSPDQSVQAKINTQRELAAIDAQIIAEQKATNDQLAALKLAAAGGDTSNAAYQAQLQANIKAEQLANQKIYADQTKILQETQQQYTTFFNSIEQGWAKAITNMLTEHKKFSTEVVSIEKQLTASFTQMVLKRVTTWIEGTALIQAAERSFNLILQALHLEQFTQTATQTAALATIQNSALAESVAAQKAADEADVISSAGAGAAAAAAEAAPEGPEAAAAAGIVMGSEILALGQFEIGGIVPGRGPVPIMAHGGEKVIDSKLTQMLVNVAQGGGGGGGFTNHGGINVYGSSGNGREQGGDIMRSIDSHVRRSNLRMA